MFRWSSFNGSFSSLFILCGLIFSLSLSRFLIYGKRRARLTYPRENESCVTPHIHLSNYLAFWPCTDVDIYIYIYICAVSSPCFMAFTHTLTHIHRPRVIRSHHEKNLRQQHHLDRQTL